MNPKLITSTLPFMKIYLKRILDTNHNVGIKMKSISKDVSLQTNKEYNMRKLTKSKKIIYFNETCHTIQIKSKKTEIEYSNKSIENFRLIVIYPTPTLSNREKKVICTYFGTSY